MSQASKLPSHVIDGSFMRNRAVLRSARSHVRLQNQVKSHSQAHGSDYCIATAAGQRLPRRRCLRARKGEQPSSLAPQPRRCRVYDTWGPRLCSAVRLQSANKLTAVSDNEELEQVVILSGHRAGCGAYLQASVSVTAHTPAVLSFARALASPNY